MVKIKQILLIGLCLSCLVGCTSKQNNSTNKEIVNEKIIEVVKNEETHVAYLELNFENKDLSTKKDYLRAIQSWIDINYTKTIISITSYPAQTEVFGIFITYSDKIPDVKYNTIIYSINDFINDPLYKANTFSKNNDYENEINFVKKYSEGVNIVTETTINSYRGGIEYLIIISNDIK